MLNRLRDHLRARRYSIRTETVYVDSVRRFIFFHVKRHPQHRGAAEAARALTFPHFLELLGYADVSTTMIYTHVLDKGGRGILSPLDAL